MPRKLTVFPRAWLWLVDESIPVLVKKKYSPRDSWKDKPFSQEDSRFFFKGIDELSSLFTEERPRGMPAYFNHPKYRSAYLLYFFPLQAAKFLALFQGHSAAIEAALKHAEKSGVLKVADIGVGPGTASLSLLLTLLEMQLEGKTKEIPQIEFHWFDTQASIMADGLILVEQISNQFPKLRGKVQVHTHVMPWWKAAAQLPENLSLVLMGHVLNESSPIQQSTHTFWRSLLNQVSGGGVLILEPATRKTAQHLSHLRDFFFENKFLESKQEHIWGPCLHAGVCPLGDGRDWCHMSVPLQIPGRWFKEFSHSLSSERHWVKFSYLWFASSAYPAPLVDPSYRRVVSDPLSQGGPRGETKVLICEPGTASHWPVSIQDQVGRGDVIEVTP